MRPGRIVIIVLLVLAFLAVQDLVLNGPDKVIGGYFEAFRAGDRNRKIVDPEELEFEKKSGVITERKEHYQGLSIINPYGEVKVEEGDGDKITVNYAVRVYTPEKEQAEQYIKKVAVSKKTVEYQQGRFLEVSLKEPKLREEFIKRVRVDYEVFVPPGFTCRINNNGGAVTVQNAAGEFEIYNTNGATIFNNIKGNLVVSTRSGELEMMDITGNIKVDYFGRYAYLAGIDGNITINNSFGGESDIIVEEVRGDLTANIDCTLEIVNLEGSVQVESRFGNVRTEDIKGPVTIYQDGFRSNIELKDVFGDINCIVNDSQIRLEIPENGGGYEITASTEHGTIRTRLPLEMKEENGMKTAKGKLGEGKYRIELKSKRGKIYIRD